MKKTKDNGKKLDVINLFFIIKDKTLNME